MITSKKNSNNHIRSSFLESQKIRMFFGWIQSPIWYHTKMINNPLYRKNSVTPFEDTTHRFKLERDVDGLWKVEAFCYGIPIGVGASHKLVKAKQEATKEWTPKLDSLLVRLRAWLDVPGREFFRYDGEVCIRPKEGGPGFQCQRKGTFEGSLEWCLIKAEAEEKRLSKPRKSDAKLLAMSDKELLTKGRTLFHKASGKAQLEILQRISKMQTNCESVKTADAIIDFLTGYSNEFDDVQALVNDLIYLSTLWKERVERDTY